MAAFLDPNPSRVSTMISSFSSSSSSSSSSSIQEWSPSENKMFEEALAELDLERPDRWEKLALTVPGKTKEQIQEHFESLVADLNSIESGLIPLPTYVDQEDGSGARATNNPSCSPMVAGKGPTAAAAGKGLRAVASTKKGIPWTEEEHRLFLMGMNSHGKGDWRSISRNFVPSRTPTQVASHAQKFFSRHSEKKERRRASILDITLTSMRLR